MTKLLELSQFVRARLRERSTWIDLIAAVGAAAALPHPWSYVGFLMGAVKALIPDGPVHL